MGQVALTYRILPDDPSVNLDALVGSIKKSLPAGARWNAHVVRPFAFGLKSIEAQIIIEDAEGGADVVTERLEKVGKVQGVELIDMGRLM